MAEQKIELRKVRDFSENISDTFTFIRQEFKPLVTSFLAVAGIFMLSTAIFGGLYQSQFGNVFKQIISNPEQQVNTMEMYGIRYFIFLFLTLLNMVAMQVTVAAYMKLYLLEKRTPTIDEVWKVFKAYYIKCVLYTLPIYLMIGFGMLLCLVPGLYWAVVLMPFQVFVVMENETVSGAYNRCFTLIKGNFWPSAGIYVVAYLIYACGAMIISTVVALVAGLLSWFTTHDLNTTIGIVTSMLGIFSYIFYLIFFVSLVLHYFTLTEKYDGTGIMERINNIGSQAQDFGHTQEHY